MINWLNFSTLDHTIRLRTICSDLCWIVIGKALHLVYVIWHWTRTMGNNVFHPIFIRNSQEWIQMILCYHFGLFTSMTIDLTVHHQYLTVVSCVLGKVISVAVNSLEKNPNVKWIRPMVIYIYSLLPSNNQPQTMGTVIYIMTVHSAPAGPACTQSLLPSNNQPRQWVLS